MFTCRTEDNPQSHQHLPKSMSSELLYTSAPQGLVAGSRGFCTVLSSTGMPTNLSRKLESLSGYNHLHYPESANAEKNPVAYSHVTTHVNGRPISILSRVSAYGLDYANRLNKLAHHIVPNSEEMASAGPAWLLNQPDLMRTSWDETCRITSAGPELPDGQVDAQPCENWNSVMADAGWGGKLAETWYSKTAKPIWITYAPEQQNLILPLIAESTALLPEKDRWRATFSTYATNIPDDFECRVRCLIAGTQAARIAAAKGTVIDISEANKSTTVSAWTEYAKTGRYVAGLPFPDAARKQPSLVSDQANQSVTPAQENQKRKFLSIIAMLALLLAGYVGWHSLNSTPVASSRSTSDPSADSAAASANSSTQHAKKLEETRIDQEPSESLNKSGTSHSNPKDFEGHEIQPDSSSPTENTPEYANAPNDGMNSGQLNQPDIGKPAKIVDSDEAAIAHSGPTANLLALENQLDNAHDLDSYAEALLQYSLAVTDPQAKKELQKTLSARRHWKAALAGNTLIKEVNALDQPSEQDLKRLTQLHATLAKDSDDNPQVTAIEQFLASRHAKQDSMEDADFSFLSEMPFANLITIESLVDENQGRMFMLADSTISTDALKTKRDTITLDIVKDVSGTTEERAINTPLRIRDEPRASIEWLIANTPPENVDFTNQWDKNILGLAAKIMQRPRLDHVIKEELVFQVLQKGADHSQYLSQGLASILNQLTTRKENRRLWANTRTFSSAIAPEVVDELGPTLRRLHKQQQTNTASATNTAIPCHQWVGFVWRDKNGFPVLRINNAPRENGSLYILKAPTGTNADAVFVRIGDLGNETAIQTKTQDDMLLGYPLFLYPPPMYPSQRSN